MQQTQQGCPFTAAAYALEFIATDTRAIAMDLRKLGASIDPLFRATIDKAFAEADRADQRADALRWLEDFCISCAQYGPQILDFVERLKSEIPEAEITRPVQLRDRRRIPPYPFARPASAQPTVAAEIAFLDRARAASL